MFIVFRTVEVLSVKMLLLQEMFISFHLYLVPPIGTKVNFAAIGKTRAVSTAVFETFIDSNSASERHFISVIEITTVF